MELPRAKAINTSNYIESLSHSDIGLTKTQLNTLRHLCEHQQIDSLTFFDIETSGLSPFAHEIIELGAIKYTLGGDQIHKFSSLIKAEKVLSQANIDIHGITNESLIDSPGKEEVLASFAEFTEYSSLVAYNSQFDVGFLQAEEFLGKLKLNCVFAYDALPLARYAYKFQTEKPENFKLSTLNTFLELNLKSHRAYEDSLACMKVFIHCTDMLRTMDKINIFRVFNFSQKLKFEITPKVDTLLTAIKNDTNVSIRYKGGSKGSEARPIKPIAILPLPTGTFLYSKCLTDDINKAFNIKKIAEVI